MDNQKGKVIKIDEYNKKRVSDKNSLLSMKTLLFSLAPFF
jgi:hypothetical protein